MISGNHTFTKTGRQRRVNYVTIIKWIFEVWNTIPTSTIINGFIKAGIINSSGVQGEVEKENQVVGSVVEWLKHRTGDQHSLGSKPTCAILLCPWERHFTAFLPAWWS